MHESRVHTCIFGLQVEEPSKAETLHFPRRQNVIPVEKNLFLAGFTCGNVWADLRILHITFFVNGHNYKKSLQIPSSGATPGWHF